MDTDLSKQHHNCYIEVEANDNYELGLKLGIIFKQSVQEAISGKSILPDWSTNKIKAKSFLDITKKTFPQYIKELEGYAKGAEVQFEEMWTLFVGAELSNITEEKCTSIVLKDGKLVGGTEDCFPEVQNDLYILRKKIGDLTILELYYTYSLGGDSISINSNGFVQLTNTLSQTDNQIGIPRNVVGRWLSETSNPKKDFELLSKLQRSSGYSHTISSMGKGCYNIELTAKNQKITEIQTPFVHTNHYLTELANLQSADFSSGVCQGSIERYEFAKNHVSANTNEGDLKNILSDQSNGSITSVFNERTIGRVIVDFENKYASIWMLREADKGWLRYDLP